MQIKIYYDKQCPFCRKYTEYIKLKDEYEIILCNARDNLKDISILNKKGFDINKGVIIEVDNSNIYQGSDVVEIIDSLSKKRLNIFDNWFFRYILYPIIKQVRKIVLLILGKNPNIKY